MFIFQYCCNLQSNTVFTSSSILRGKLELSKNEIKSRNHLLGLCHRNPLLEERLSDIACNLNNAYKLKTLKYKASCFQSKYQVDLLKQTSVCNDVSTDQQHNNWILITHSDLPCLPSLKNNPFPLGNQTKMG